MSYHIFKPLWYSFLMEQQSANTVIGNMTLKIENLRIDSIEIIDCSNDASLLANWGKRLYKLLLTGNFAKSGEWSLLFNQV